MVLSVSQYGSRDNYQIAIYFYSIPQFHLSKCMKNHNRYFSPNIPSEVYKVWTIARLPGPRLTMHVNGVLVEDITLADLCKDREWGDNWRYHYTRQQARYIMFWSETVLEYRAAPPGKLLTMFNITC